jgi:teichuronic acid biosynthesis glycosyltransferase TuaG
LISVIVPIFNAERSLRSCVESILSQSYENIEIWLIDDCSTDGSQGICLEYSREHYNINFLKTSKNSGGPAYPRNIGIENAKGRYIAFIDADDLWDARKISYQAVILDKYDSIKIVCSNATIIDSENQTRCFFSPNSGSISKLFSIFGKHRILLHNYIIMSSAMVRSEVFAKVRFEEWLPLAAIEDWALWMKIILNNSHNIVYHLDKPLVHYRYSSNSLSRQDYKKQLLKVNILYSWLSVCGVISSPFMLCLQTYNIARCMTHRIKDKFKSYFK